MESAIASGFQGLLLGITNLTAGHVLMILIGSLLLYLGIKRGYEPLLLVPIGFGAILVNIPLAGLMNEDGILRYFYENGILTEIFPVLIFLGIGAMTDFSPLFLTSARAVIAALLGAACLFALRQPRPGQQPPADRQRREGVLLLASLIERARTLDVSAIGLGCMSLSHAYGTPPEPEAAAAVLRRAVDPSSGSPACSTAPPEPLFRLRRNPTFCRCMPFASFWTTPRPPATASGWS